MAGDATHERRAAAVGSRGRDLLIHLLPGLLAGIQLTGLLFFLNPRIPFSVGPFVRSFALLGGLGAAASGLLLSAMSWRRPGRARRWLPWTITVVLAACAVGDWIHASLFAYYVPPGINVRLIKTALWLTLATLACFYTALLHSLHRRPYGLRSRLGLGLAALVSVVVLIERREAYQPEPSPPPQPSAIEPEPRPALLVVGLDGATLDAVLPLARQGHLPFLARQFEEGAYARLETQGPLNATALWTSLATGTYPYKHGVLGPSVYSATFLADGAVMRLLPFALEFPDLRRIGWARRATAGPHRDAAAAWQVLASFGMPAGVVGWPATYHPDQSLAYAFSDLYFADDFGLGSARPPELAERGILFRLAVDELDAARIEPFGREVPHALLRSLAGDQWRESLTSFLVDQERHVRGTFVMLPGLHDISRRYFGGYSAVQFGGSQEATYQEAANYVTHYYRHLDGFVASLWDKIMGPKMLAVVSPHGFSAPGGVLRLWRRLTKRSLEGTLAGEPDGLLILRGRGVLAGATVEEAQVTDVLPTLLYGLGLPIAQDLDGRVLTGVFDPDFLARHPLTYVPTYQRPGN